LNVAEGLIEFAHRLGAKTCFSLPGGMAMYLNKAISDHPGISEVFNYQEQACISSAEGYVKASNFQEIGMACITAGPGVSNSVTGLLSAFGDSVPMLVFAGQIKELDINKFGLRTHGIQEIDSEAIVKPCVKRFIRISKVKLLDQLFEIRKELMIGRPGPIFIEVPLNVQSLDFEETLIDEVLKIKIAESSTLSFLDSDYLENTVLSAKKLGIYIGNGYRISQSNLNALLHIADTKHIPRFYSWLSFDLENFANELNMGCPGSLASIHSNQIFQSCDVVIFLGARLDLGTTAFQPNKFAKNAKRIIVDVDPKELMKFDNQNDFLVNRDILEIHTEIIDLITKRDDSVSKEQRIWIEKGQELKKSCLEEENTKLASKDLNTRFIAMEMSKIAKNATIVAASSGIAEETFTRFLRPNGNMRFFNGAALGAMGQGLAQGIGAAIYNRRNESHTWVFEADGGLWMSIHEIATMSQIKKSKLTLCILNNNSYGSIELSQRRHLDFNSGTNNSNGLNLPDWEKVAEVYSFAYYAINTQEDFYNKSDLFLNENNSVIVDFRIPISENRGPSLKTIMTPEGPITPELESISW
jgi:acetolactate synthase-1/2/3 large subunit